MLARFGATIFGAEVADPPKKDVPARDVGSPLRHRQTSLVELLRKDCKFILFGGKGGVGKTSLAAAMALKIAEQRPKDRVLVLSIDPAHSLSDCLACSVGNKAVRISAPGLLEAKELNAEDLFKAYTDEYRRDIAQAFKLAGSAELRFDREVVDELLSVWPAGLDEIMALVEMLELADAYDVVVLDTAPTGHLLRFLEMPELARQWLKAIFRIILKHQAVINLTEVGEKLVRLSRDIRRVQGTLTDADQTTLVAVTIPETMAMAETQRLLASLKRLGVACRDLVINMVTPSQASCPFCRARRCQERRCIRETAGPADVATTEVPMLANEIRGINALRALSSVALGPAESWIRRFLGAPPKRTVLPRRPLPACVGNPAPDQARTCRR
jgi:arsenite-transporting ATPase